MIVVWRVQRQSSGPDRPDYFIRKTGRRPWLKIVHNPPPFEGPEATFEVERLPGKADRFVRQVNRTDLPNRKSPADPENKERDQREIE